MKIEAGESLVYSWMRHIKKCQFVQTNWKVSPKWDISGTDTLEALFDEIAEHFQQKHGLEVFKEAGFQQTLRQLECDVIGLAYREQGSKLYAAEVAFHEGGLNYGSKDETVAKVISKLARIAFGLHCYLGASDGVVLFASPKINPAICDPLKQRIPELEKIFQSHGMEFAFRLVANDTFTSEILNPVLKVSGEVADTSELFLRCYQLSKMRTDAGTNAGDDGRRAPVRKESTHVVHDDEFAHLKVGELANIVVRKILESGVVSPEEVARMTTKEYSRETLYLGFCCLSRQCETISGLKRYYTTPLYIAGERYYLCSQWRGNKKRKPNHRPYLLAWIRAHTDEQSRSALASLASF